MDGREEEGVGIGHQEDEDVSVGRAQSSTHTVT
jgi:hypothetical protein